MSYTWGMSTSPRFKRGANIAWLLHGDQAYREVASSEWQLTQVDKAHRDSLSLSEVIKGKHDVPEVVLKPLRGGEVRVTAAFPLLVLRQGESAPRLEGRSVEVPLGSVIKAGPALFAVLDAEQARDVRRGALELPCIEPEPTPESEGAVDDGSVSMVKLAATLRWSRAHRLYLLAAVASLFVAGFVVYKMAHPPLQEGRVLVFLQGLPVGDEALIRRSLDGRLRSTGLEPVFFDTLVTPSTACIGQQPEGDELSVCARSMGAPHVMSLVMTYSTTDESADGLLTAQVVRLGRARPFESRSVELHSAPEDDPATTMWEQGLVALVPQMVADISTSHAGMGPQTPYSLSSPF